METSQFVDQLAAGEAAKAKETLTDLVSARAFQALEDRKMDIAKSMFGGQETAADDQVDIEVLDANEINGVRMGDIEVQDTEDTEA
jgi:hypothetical protein